MTRWSRRIVHLILAVLVMTVAWPTFARAAGETLKRGDKGSSVKELQTLLKEKGYLKIDKVTEYFGKDTENAVMAFQKKNSIKVDGITGKTTWEKLKKSLSSDNIADPSDGVLEIGDEGNDVRDVQTRLKELGLLNQSRITGYYGNLTKAAVIRFQESLDLKADGVVGTKTKKLLFEEYSASTLVPGMVSQAVKKMQERLKELGYFTANATGQFGTITQKAVSYFQRGNSLTDDGIAGKKTLDKLYSPKAVKEKDARRKVSSTSGTTTKTTSKILELIDKAKSYIGSPYVYGASGPDTFDCSGFTMFIFKKFGISLPHSAYYQAYKNYGTKIDSISKLKVGDLVFFDTIKESDKADHVGIYVGGGNFIQAPSTGDKVKISSINSNYYKAHFSWGKRIL